MPNYTIRIWGLYVAAKSVATIHLVSCSELVLETLSKLQNVINPKQYI